jgi:hypothetical protein
MISTDSTRLDRFAAFGHKYALHLYSVNVRLMAFFSLWVAPIQVWTQIKFDSSKWCLTPGLHRLRSELAYSLEMYVFLLSKLGIMLHASHSLATPHLLGLVYVLPSFLISCYSQSFPWVGPHSRLPDSIRPRKDHVRTTKKGSEDHRFKSSAHDGGGCAECLEILWKCI